MADAFFTCGTSSTGAADRVHDQFAKANSKTDEIDVKVLDAVSQLAALQAPSVMFQLPPVQVFNYTIEPYVPNPNTLDPVDMHALDAQLPAAPADPGPLPTIDVGPAPTAPTDAPAPQFDPIPVIYRPAFQPAPVVVNPTAPVMSDLTGSIIPPVPRPIELPTVPNIDINSIVFQGVAPRFTATPPDPADFDYVEPDYQEQITQYVKPAIQAMLNGQSGLPAAIENAIWAREAEREDENALRAEMDATDAWAGRGHGLPGGALARQILLAQQNNQNQSNTLGRDVAIDARKTLIAQLQFSVAQGLAFEDLFVRKFNEIQNRKLQAKRFALDLTISVFNALVGQYQAEASVFKVFADVYLAELQGELAKLQVYSEQLRAAEIIGKLNEQDLQLYLGRLQAIKVNIDAYVASVQGYVGQIQGNNLIIDQAKLLIDEERAKLEASDISVKAWLGGVQGQGLMQQAYATRAQVYTSSMQGFDIRNRVEIEKLRLQIADDEAITQRYNALINGFGQLVNYSRSRGELVIQNNQVKLQAYQADVAGKSAYNTALVQKMQNVQQDLIAVREIQLKNAEINMQNLLEVHRIIVQKMETVANVLAGMGSAYASSTHVGAQIADSSSDGTSCNFNTSQTIG